MLNSIRFKVLLSFVVLSFGGLGARAKIETLTTVIAVPLGLISRTISDKTLPELVCRYESAAANFTTDFPIDFLTSTLMEAFCVQEGDELFLPKKILRANLQVVIRFLPHFFASFFKENFQLGLELVPKEAFNSGMDIFLGQKLIGSIKSGLPSDFSQVELQEISVNFAGGFVVSCLQTALLLSLVGIISKALTSRKILSEGLTLDFIKGLIFWSLYTVANEGGKMLFYKLLYYTSFSSDSEDFGNWYIAGDLFAYLSIWAIPAFFLVFKKVLPQNVFFKWHRQ